MPRKFKVTVTNILHLATCVLTYLWSLKYPLFARHIYFSSLVPIALEIVRTCVFGHIVMPKKCKVIVKNILHLVAIFKYRIYDLLRISCLEDIFVVFFLIYVDNFSPIISMLNYSWLTDQLARC